MLDVKHLCIILLEGYSQNQVIKLFDAKLGKMQIVLLVELNYQAKGGGEGRRRPRGGCGSGSFFRKYFASPLRNLVETRLED